MAPISTIRAVAIGGAGILMASCSSSWQHTVLSVNRCVAEAKIALRDADFTQHLHVVVQSNERTVLGKHGAYKASVRCIPGQRAVEVTGWDQAMTDFYKKSIIKRF